MKRLSKKENGKVTEASTKTYKCEKCGDTTWIITEKGAVPCECQKLREHEVMQAVSDVGLMFQNKNFGNFKVETDVQRVLKEECMEYVKKFIKSNMLDRCSLCICGNVGTGKTHLASAVANNLIAKNIGVVKINYRTFITRMKQRIVDSTAYDKDMDRVTEAEVLFIDDLYKGRITESDANIMYEIINRRYENHRPLILTTEKSIESLLNFDEGIASRIIEMCGGNILSSKGQNMRLCK